MYINIIYLDLAELNKGSQPICVTGHTVVTRLQSYEHNC